MPLPSAGGERLDAQGAWERGGEGYARHTCLVCHASQATGDTTTPNPIERSLPWLNAGSGFLGSTI